MVATTLVHLVTQTPPFNRAVDAGVHQQKLAERLERVSADLSDDELIIFSEIDRKARIDDLIDAIGRSYMDRRQWKKALATFELGQRRRPWLPNSLVFSAACLVELHRNQEARAAIAASLNSAIPATPPIAQLRDRLNLRLDLRIRKNQ